MITVSRTVDPKDVLAMSEHFTLDEAELKNTLTEQVVAALKQTPERVFVLKVMKDKELIGFVIAESGYGESINLAQAWTNKRAPWAVSNVMFARLQLWAVGMCKTKIQVTSSRSSEALYRRFGFEETAKVLSHTIDPELSSRLVETMLLEEVPDGRSVQEA